VSGRSRADLLPRLEGLPLVAAIGNHGAEAGHGPVDRSLRGAVEGWKASLSRCVAGLPGVELEDKGLSLALHYRRAPSRAAARRALRAATGALPGARVLAGRAVVNVVPAGASDKGAAVAHVLERAGRRRALYVGDDRSDETAFRAEGVAVGVRVGRTHASAAPYYLPSQAAIDDLLRCIVASRCRLDGRAATPDAVDRWLTFDA
jgi:trehalose 6-phosphate phosphatase